MTLGMAGKEKWNNFVLENNGLFLQSWEWGEFQKSLNRKIWRIGDCENWATLVIKYDLPMGKNYLYCPGGPVSSIKHDVSSIMPIFLEEVEKIAKKEKSIFLKMEPFMEIPLTPPLEKGEDRFVPPFFKGRLGGIFKKSDGGQRILKTLILDLNKSEEELLVEMKQKTRYNIRLAEKHGVKIRISSEPEKDAEYFFQLAKETSQRDGFHLHSREYYVKQLLFCHPEPVERKAKDLVGQNEINDEIPRFTRNDELCAKLFLAEYQNKIIAANIAVFFGNRAIYLHGASSNEHRNLMAPYLLQWEQIREAKKRGCEIYDFWGIDEKKWPGVTRFKNGFNGKEIDYVGTYDYVFDRMWYGIYRIGKLLFQMSKFTPPQPSP